MYRLAIYYLASLLLLAFLLSLARIMPYNPWHILISGLYMVAIAYIANIVFAKLTGVKANKESAIITGFILALIVGPLSFMNNLLLITFVAVIAMASKYIFMWRRVHIFNPAAFAVVASVLVFNYGASWWVGSYYLMPLIAVFGFVVLRKVKREKLFASFLLTYLGLFIVLNRDVVSSLDAVANFSSSLYFAILPPILFFSFIMLTEPQTSPKTERLRIYYGAFVAVAFIAYQALFNVQYTLELALLTGNLFSFIVTRDLRITLSLRKKEELAPGIYGFWFKPENNFNFRPGQYLEWTLYHKRADNRGIRRYFTIASSPTEKKVLLAVKIPKKSSSFKKALLGLKEKNRVLSTGAQGDFLLPEDKNRKIVFIAGGIGITPFRSMVKYLMDKGERRDIILLYSASTAEEFIFNDVFGAAASRTGLKMIYSISDKKKAPSRWDGEVGMINAGMIKKRIIDWEDRTFYVSGPEPMVKSMEKTLRSMGVDNRNIKKDYFPGYEGI